MSNEPTVSKTVGEAVASLEHAFESGRFPSYTVLFDSITANDAVMLLSECRKRGWKPAEQFSGSSQADGLSASNASITVTF